MERWSGVILAAGAGTRMKSRRPKVLHPLCGAPMVRLVVEAMVDGGIASPLLVLPANVREFLEALGSPVQHVVQEQPRGTGDALSVALARIGESAEHVLVANGDIPLVRTETLRVMMEFHASEGADITLLTSHGTPGQGLGRVVRDDDGAPLRIVEAEGSDGRGTSPLVAGLLAALGMASLGRVAPVPGEDLFPEVNVGVYCFRMTWLREAIRDLRPSSTGEVRITDLVEVASRQGARCVTHTLRDPLEGLGVNTRVDLAHAEGVLRQRIREHWMLQGVTMTDPATVYIDWGVTLGADTVLHPNTFLLGKSSVGSECEVGPGSLVRDSVLGARCKVQASVVEEAVLEEGVDVGPFSHLRPGAYLESGVHIGNYGEVKQSRLGRGVKMGHFSYVGDATIGANVNIGAGTITCNFDGVKKNATVVEEEVFLGSDTLLVAPVRVGARAATGAGSVVVRDIPPGTLAAGMPARVVKRLPS